ncbi:hybrid histidine kinase/response regulator HrmK [Nostoc sp. 'Lobaria pulmonaria (5183) cyanobiont']|uniref:hybrid histidine kinase/response regulator HrmK n=1 Tax=Nostoc sp. 'Lobaria pulmonaria (5183) cyanobiont' TaxID=1618022 RepID=UPI000CF30651|nr:hybrid histidine kinase/response regulator HrmK [Nostoc sp. 'Lobaria pulmonaria (5183) cyanobiont']AVH72025.1 histidine kinase [Nostoc sp. 'Lobaria pulmonaria (5183) cyanobiont']
MQQYSSLPDQNSLIDATPKLLTTIEIEQLRAQLRLESSLNQLQSRLDDCFPSACNTVPQTEAAQAEFFQTVVNEINIAVDSSNLALTECAVGIAMCQPQETVATVCYISRSPSPNSQPLFLEVLTAEKKLLLRLQEVIKLEDLQQLENQQLPSAWRLADDSGSVIWLIIATAHLSSDHESLIESQAQLRSQLMARSARYCTKALLQLRHILSLQQQCQQLSNSNQELERTNQLKNQFLANTSHEIRTLLSCITMPVSMLLTPGFEATIESLRHYLNIIQSSAKHLLALINDILDLSKIEANQLEVNWKTLDVQFVCDSVFALVKEKAADKGLKLRLEINPDITTLVADELRLRQMLLNLLWNALKFTSEGSVGLEVVLEGVFVHFTVWDTGTGISQEDKDQLFQRYFQVAKTNGVEGTGLGLALTQKLAQIHGGSVKVESEVDRGSRFILILPLNQEAGVGGAEEAGEARFSSSPLPLTPSSSGEILLVENDLPNANLIQIYLNRLGYQVTLVENAAQMWKALRQLDPAVILMDVCLADGNGLHLVQQIREHEQYQTIPVIVQTAMAMRGDRETCLAAGANDYISKPIDLPLLASLVAKYSQAPTLVDGEWGVGSEE